MTERTSATLTVDVSPRTPTTDGGRADADPADDTVDDTDGGDADCRVIIAGTRSFGSGIPDERMREFVDEQLDAHDINPDVVVSGCCGGDAETGATKGADLAGELWAAANGVPVDRYPADWDSHGKAAGPIRNKEMARNADVLLALWDGQSPGTRSMIDAAEKRLGSDNVYVVRYDQ